MGQLHMISFRSIPISSGPRPANIGEAAILHYMIDVSLSCIR